MENKSFDLMDALAILFIALKLTGVIKWSWLWVLSPIWLDVLAAIIVAVIIEIHKRGGDDR